MVLQAHLKLGQENHSVKFQFCSYNIMNLLKNTTQKLSYLFSKVMSYIKFTKNYSMSISFASLTDRIEMILKLHYMVAKIDMHICMCICICKYMYMHIFAPFLILCHNVVVNLSDLSRIFILFFSSPVYYREEFLQGANSPKNVHWRT